MDKGGGRAAFEGLGVQLRGLGSGGDSEAARAFGELVLRGVPSIEHAILPYAAVYRNAFLEPMA